MTSVTPPSGDSRVYQLTDVHGHRLSATVQVVDLGTTVAANYVIGDQNTVHITVSGRATPASVPTLVVAALAEAAAELAGVRPDQPDRLAPATTGDAKLSRRDHGRAAQLLNHAQTLRQRPHDLRTRSRLKKLILDMGLDPTQEGAGSRLRALPDERMREAVREHTRDPDGLLGTMWYLGKSVAGAIPVPATLGIVASFGLIPVPVAVAIAAVSVSRALVQGFLDRSTTLRESEGADRQLAGTKHQLSEQYKESTANDLLRVFAHLRFPGEPVAPAATTSGETVGPAAVTAQIQRIVGLRRGLGALGGTLGLGVVLGVSAFTPLLGPIASLSALGIFAGTMAPALAGMVADTVKKHYTMRWKAERMATLMAEVQNQTVGRRHEITNSVKDITNAILQATSMTQPDRGSVSNTRFVYSDDIPSQWVRALIPQSRANSAKDRDPNGLAAALSLTAEYGAFRAVNIVVGAALGLVTGGRQFTAEQAASAARKEYDLRNEGNRDLAAYVTGLAKILNETVPALVSMFPNADAPLASDPQRPSPLPSRNWMAVSFASGLLMVGVAAGLEIIMGLSGVDKLFGVPSLVAVAAAGAVGAPADAALTRKWTRMETRPADVKGELARSTARDGRDDLVAAMDDFTTRLFERSTVEPRTSTRDPGLDQILAARDEALADIVNEVRTLTDQRLSSYGELAKTFLDKLVSLREIATVADELMNVREAAGQPRAEVAARNKLIAAIQRYNGIPGVTPISAASLFDGVHAASTDRAAPPMPPMPALPADVNGQTAAVTLDRHLGDPDTPFQAPADLERWSGNEGWGARIADAAGVPSRRFRPVSAINDIVGRLRQLGEGSRAIVHAQRKDGTGLAESGDLFNAVNIGGDVFFLDAVSGGLAEVTNHADDLSMLITNDNGERDAAMEGREVVAAVRDAAERIRGGYEDFVPGSLLIDPAAPGLPARAEPTDLGVGITRIASVINPSIGNEMPRIRAFSDQWDRRGEEERPIPSARLIAGVGAVRATAGLATAMLATFGDSETTDLPEYQRLDTLLREEEVPVPDLFDAMTELMEALQSAAP